MPLKLSTLTFLLVGLLWLGPGLEIPASAKGLLGFGKKKEKVVPPPSRATAGAAGKTVFLTKYGPLTATQYRARLMIEEEKRREAVQRAAERREGEALARQKAAAEATREQSKAEQARTKEAAEDREKAARLAAKQAEQASKKLDAQKKAEADRIRSEQAALEKKEARVRALQEKARRDAEKREASAIRTAASARSKAAKLSPAARMIEMERIARELAVQRSTGNGPGRTEIVSASSLGLTKENAASGSAKTAGTGSKIERLNQSIFDIVRKRTAQSGRAEIAALKRVTEGELYLTTKARTPFYYYNPLQHVLPDLYLGKSTQVALVKRGKIWSDVRLEDGKEGVIANDFLEMAPIVEIELPPDNAVAKSSYGFRYTPVPKDYVPPALPGETDLADRTPTPFLLPPLRSETP